MYAVGIVGSVFLLLGIFLLTRHADSPMLIVGLPCVLIGIVLARISRASRRR